MTVANRTVLVTGAARGIGRALAHACADAGARVALTDVRADELAAARDALGGEHVAVACDLRDPVAIEAMVGEVASALGPIDVCFANAGVAVGTDPLSTDDATWELAYAINVRQHIVLSRLLLPGWLAAGAGCFVATVSAAGLLTQIGSAPYSVTKHAALGYAEWLSITYGDRGVQVSAVCPMGVDTAMLDPASDTSMKGIGAAVVRGAGDVLAPDAVARMILDGVADGRFLILPHPEVATYVQRKAADHERWIRGMRRAQAAAEA